jgi:thiol-disulfide isomerase/thioredoxin
MNLLFALLFSCTTQQKTPDVQEIITRPTEEVEVVLQEDTSSTEPEEEETEEPEEVDPDTAACDTAIPDPITWTECSYKISEHICNVTLPDVDEVIHELYSYYGRPIVIQLSAEWCGPCNTAGTHAEGYMERYADHDLLWVTIILENTAGEPATTLDLMQWEASMNTVNALTLAGSRDLIDLTAENGFPLTSWPTFVVINTDMTIYHGFYGWSEAYLTSVLDSML